MDYGQGKILEGKMEGGANFPTKFSFEKLALPSIFASIPSLSSGLPFGGFGACQGPRAFGGPALWIVYTRYYEFLTELTLAYLPYVSVTCNFLIESEIINSLTPLYHNPVLRQR
uniref:Uncharacterized protein n=1 Tax=Cacopsylla melanoneura TaxID=428564 RepID=A0A8D8ZWV9_9HEMI